MEKKEDKVIVRCYGTAEEYDRPKAIRFFKEGVLCSEGSERERYSYILAELLSGSTYIDDDMA